MSTSPRCFACGLACQRPNTHNHVGGGGGKRTGSALPFKLPRFRCWCRRHRRRHRWAGGRCDDSCGAPDPSVQLCKLRPRGQRSGWGGHAAARRAPRTRSVAPPTKKIKKRGKKREDSEHAGDRPTSTPSAARCGRATAVEGRGERERPGGRLGQGGSGCCTPPPVQWAIHPWRQQQQPIAPRGADAARIWRAAAHLRPMGCTRAYIWHAPPPSAPSAHMARRPLAAPAAHRRRHERWGSIPPRGGRGGWRCRHRGHVAAGWPPQSEAGGLTLGGRPPTAASSSGAGARARRCPDCQTFPPTAADGGRGARWYCM